MPGDEVLALERRASALVAVRRLARGGDTPQWRRRADAERERLREAARAGNPTARRALADIGEAPPPPRPWSDTDRDDEEGT